jgi:hypothetical protein
MRRIIATPLVFVCSALAVFIVGTVVHAQANLNRTGANTGGAGSSSGSLSGTGSSGFLNSSGGTGTGTSGFLNSGTGSGTGSSGFLSSGTSGTGLTGNTTGGGARTGSGSSQGISSSNPFGANYINLMTLGLPSGASKPRFGSPLYNITTSTAQGANRGGTATISGNTNVQSYPGASSIGVRRTPAYSTTIGFDYEPPSPGSLQAKAQDAIAKASKQLKSRESIIVAMDGETLVLRGSAANANERRLAEALVRLTPGIYDVRNELEVPELAPPPRRIP